MIFLLFLNSLVNVESLKFYDSVGSLGGTDIRRSDCFTQRLDFRCNHVHECKKWLRGLDRLCNRRQARRLHQKQAARQDQPQFDDHNSRKHLATTNPYFVTSIRNITVNEGDTVTLKCAASGKPMPKVAISSLKTYQKLQYHNRRNTYDGYREVFSEFTIFNISENNAGWYRCAAVNTKSYQTTDNYITVIRNPCLNTQCAGFKTCVNRNGVARCECPKLSDCSSEPLHPVCGNDCVSYFNLCTMKVRACMTGMNISIWLENSVCPAVEEPSVNPVQSQQMRIQAGASLRLKCGAKGNPHPDVAWYRQSRAGLEKLTEEDLLEVKNIKSGQSGKYLCMATNCLSHSIRSKVVNVDVLAVRESARKVCHVFGDPHVTTFGGSMYSFVGACDYVLTMDCSYQPRWFVYGRIKPCGENSSCLQSITAIADGSIVQFLRGWIVNNNGTNEIIAPGGRVDIGSLHISFDKDGLLYRISLGDSGVTVTWDGYSSATVIANKAVNSCGLCGDYSGDEVARSHFSGYYNNVQDSTSDTSKNISSWKLDQWQMQCPKTVALDGAPFTDTCKDQVEDAIVSEECSKVIESSDFGHCLKSDEQRDFYLRACVRDTCGHDSDWAFCEFVESIKQHCEQETEIPVNFNLPQCPTKSGRKLEMIRHLL